MIIGEKIKEWFSLENSSDLTARLAGANDIRTALDIGCGAQSPFTQLRPGVTTVGLDSDEASLQTSRERNAHDHYIRANILKDDVKAVVKTASGVERFDIVGLFGVIEHLTKQLGYTFLQRCEELTDKFIVLETPNGFVPQGAELGNEHNRHLSGWFIHDFVGLGYTVVGTTGTRYLRGQVAGIKYPYRGVGSLDVVLARLLRANRNPRHAFNLFAYKDVRAVPPVLVT